MSVFDFYAAKSHPDKLLTDHLKGVAALIKQQVSRIGSPFEGFRELAIACGLTHDLGKATNEFQKYLIASEHDKDRLSGQMTNHAHLSSVLTMVVAQQGLENAGLTDKERMFWTAEAGLVVARHHGNLPNTQDFLSGYTFELRHKRNLYALEARLDIEKIAGWLVRQMKVFNILGKFPDFSNWNTLVEQIDDFLFDFNDFIKEHESSSFYTHVTLLYSLLIGADKLDAALGSTQPPPLKKVKPGIVPSYKADKFKGPASDINELRNQAAKEVRENFAKAMEKDARLFTLTAPTGIGKTLMALDLGLEYVAKHDVPLIYCLPFTSIIDQTFDTVGKVLKHDGLDADAQDLLLKHHYLAPVKYKNTEGLDTDQQEILVEAWNSRIVITTFVQIFDTLFSGRNRAMKKLMQIPGAMVILDEVQGIPRRYWELVRETFKTFASNYGTRFLLMTATQPRILQRGALGVVELLPRYQDYFSALSRVELHVHLNNAISIKELADQIKKNLENGKRRVIAIVNTIQDSILLYKEVSERLKNTNILYLSSNLIPLDRQERIETLKTLKEWVLITTQVVEAGVDISAQVVHRDMAPLDSIVQAAGRCNRNREENNKGVVHVWRVQREDAKQESSKWVYDAVLLGASGDALREVLGDGHEVIPDHDFAQLVEKYFKFVEKRGSEAGANGKNVLDMLKAMNFKKLGEEAQLIPDTVTNRYFVVRKHDPDARSLWEEYQNIRKEPDFRTRHNRFMGIKAKFFQRMISVREQCSHIDGIQLLEQEYQSGQGGYDARTGYVRSKDACGGAAII